MRVLLAQINPTIGNINGNLSKVLKAIDLAKAQHLDVVLFPELCLSGYPPEDFLLLPHFINDIESALQKVIKASDGLSVIIGLPRHNPDRREKNVFNSAAVISNQKLLGFQEKMLLPTYDVFDERRYFEPSSHYGLWEIAGKKVAVTICEDIWQHSASLKETFYHRDPISEIASLHPQVVFNLSASPYSVSKHEDRIRVCQKAAKTLSCPLLLCNQVGGNDSLIFDGYSLFINGQGQLEAAAKGFQEDFFVVDLDHPKKEPIIKPNTTEDLYKALVLGVHDYFKKSGFSRACLGLSGGIDSALVACIAVDALGKENVLGILMPSRFSSHDSLTDARQLANNLQIATKEIPIEHPFQSYLDLLTPHFEEIPFNTTEENIQARVRGMILMALSNKLGYIVLSTGNKSELAMGYSTLYGDLCGGLGVINDVTKQQVYALSKWINREKEIIPVNTIDKPPSAELRPNQKDTDSLPEYEIVDNVLQAYLEEHLPALKISERFSYPLSLVESLIKKIHTNEYKRRQGPPGLRISEKAFSVGRRFPIVQKYVT